MKITSIAFGFAVLGALAALAPHYAAAESTLADFGEGRFKAESYEALNWPDVLAGSLEGKKRIEINAELFLPDGDGPFPSVIIAHDSGGTQRNHEFAYARLLAANGIAAVVLDSFKSRNVKPNGLGIGNRVHPMTMTADVFSVLLLIGTHPKIDPERVGLLGFSAGGYIAMHAADWKVSEFFAGDRTFASYFAVYPSCQTQLKTLNPNPIPAMLLLAENDDVITADACLRLADRINAAGGQIETHVYPNAHHGFDRGRSRKHQGNSFVNCFLSLADDGVVEDAATGERLDSRGKITNWTRGCVNSAGVTTGGDLMDDVSERLVAFMKRTLDSDD